jgi:hypothetical protein
VGCCGTLVGTAGAACWFGEQANRFNGKLVHVLPFVELMQTFSEMEVFSGPLHSTTCLPLFTSIVEQLVLIVVVVLFVVVVVVDGVVEVISNVAVSGSTNRACAIVSTQN